MTVSSHQDRLGMNEVTSVRQQYRRETALATAYARSRGLSAERAEDFAQDWAIKKFVKSTKQSFAQAYIDFLRVEFGNTRSASGSKKSNDRRYTDAPSEYVERRADTSGEGFGYSKRDLEKRLALLDQTEYYVTKRLLDGAAQHDVAKDLGLTASRIYQIMRDVKEKTQVADLSKEFEVDWITL